MVDKSWVKAFFIRSKPIESPEAITNKSGNQMLDASGISYIKTIEWIFVPFEFSTYVRVFTFAQSIITLLKIVKFPSNCLGSRLIL